MLQSIRDNSKGIVAKIIVGLIAVTFALFGVESLVSLTSGSNAPATVNGEEISERDVLQGADLQRRQLLTQMGENADPTLLDDNLIRKAVLEGLIEQEVLRQSAVSQDMTISDQQLDQLIVSTPDFQVDGQFNRQQYEAVLRNAGFSPLLYKQLLLKDKLIEQERAGYVLSAFTLEDEAEQVVALDRQTRDFAVITLSAEDYKAQQNVTAENISAYYEDNKSEFMTEEQVIIEYLMLNKADLRGDVEVDEAELQSQFDQRLAAFQAQEERQISHILIELGDDEAAAEAKANELYAQLQGGADFAELARAESDDPGSADAGGDLGVYFQGMIPGAFDDTVNTLGEGELSAPVRTDFGYHLVKVNAITNSEPPSFEALKDQLIEEQVANKVESLYVEKLEQLADLTFSAGDLQDPSEELQLEIITAPAFGRNGGSDELTSNQRVLRQAFDQELIQDGINSTPIELDSGRTMVLRVKEHIRPRQEAETEVAAVIRTRLIDQGAAEALQSDIDSELANLRNGAERTSIQGADWAVADQVNRADREQQPQVVQQVFKMAQPSGDVATYTSLDLFDGNKAIIALTKVNNADIAALTEEERVAMQAMLAQRVGQFDYQALLKARQAAAEIERL
ncbi:SurA N-terminal domain-containing protein [Aliamphritea hakodatensis]|uniref:SurA N-terminal domain-containing protein n=1 Tax=Aliamphritea hakodatensis TaxID=2895352 RepID=UPI0022FDAA29|nr:SurA N-terminal domain-containing protein [Aliamphritea hakodatensis]